MGDTPEHPTFFGRIFTFRQFVSNALRSLNVRIYYFISIHTIRNDCFMTVKNYTDSGTRDVFKDLLILAYNRIMYILPNE